MRINRKKLLIAMLEADLNQKQLAELSGVSRGTINGIKNGRSCSDATGYKIARALKMNVFELTE